MCGYVMLIVVVFFFGSGRILGIGRCCCSELVRCLVFFSLVAIGIDWIMPPPSDVFCHRISNNRGLIFNFLSPVLFLFSSDPLSMWNGGGSLTVCGIAKVASGQSGVSRFEHLNSREWRFQLAFSPNVRSNYKSSGNENWPGHTDTCKGSLI